MNRKNTVILAVICFAVTVIVCLFPAGKNSTATEVDMRTVGKFCVSQVYPSAQWTAEHDGEEQKKKEKEKDIIGKTEKKPVDNSKPQVIIYHTHSSESYQPYTESNFHREDEKGTVREVGEVMASELNELGVSVVHEKKIHDRPSYNQSYDRSLETITSLQAKYPTAEVIIDLHRDAAAYTGNKGETMEINGDTAAEYKLVIGQSNANYSELVSFAGKVNKAADELYPGFSGRVLEKEYRYNEYISDKYLLLEVGNNQNDIEHAKATGKYFAHVLAKVLEEE